MLWVREGIEGLHSGITTVIKLDWISEKSFFSQHDLSSSLPPGLWFQCSYCMDFFPSSKRRNHLGNESWSSHISSRPAVLGAAYTRLMWSRLNLEELTWGLRWTVVVELLPFCALASLPYQPWQWDDLAGRTRRYKIPNKNENYWLIYYVRNVPSFPSSQEKGL